MKIVSVILSYAKDPALGLSMRRLRDSRTSRAQAFFTTFRMTQKGNGVTDWPPHYFCIRESYPLRYVTLCFTTLVPLT